MPSYSLFLFLSLPLSRSSNRALTGWSLNVSPEELDVVAMVSKREERRTENEETGRCVDGLTDEEK